MNIDNLVGYFDGTFHYCRERTHSEIFLFSGFETFFETNFGSQNPLIEQLTSGGHNHRISKFSTIEELHRIREDDHKLIMTIRDLNLDGLWSNANKKTIINGTNLVFSQWEKLAKEYGVDISEEKQKFKEIQESTLNVLQRTIDFRKKVEELKFKAMTFKSTFYSAKINKERLSSLLSFIDENIDVFKNSNLKELYSTGLFGLLDCKHMYTELSENILLKIRKVNPNALMSDAETFRDTFGKTDFENSNIKNFFLKKLEDNILEDVVLSKGQKNQRAILFMDSSCVFIDKSGNIIIPKNSQEMKDKTSELFIDIIDFKLRKQPKFSKLFKQKYKEDSNIEAAISSIDAFISNYEILKNIGIPSDFFSKSFESMDDYIRNESKKYKVNNYATSILSSKYKSLYTESAYPFFEKFYEENLTEEFIQQYIGKKLAMLKTPEDFTAFVKKIHDDLFVFGRKTVEMKLQSLNKEAIILNDDLSIVEICNFEESKKFGTSNWCISRSESYFRDYTDQGSRQYFVYDFSKNAEDTYSMIGITLYKDGSIRAAHRKDDDNVSNNSSVNEFALKILVEQFEDYKDDMKDNLRLKVIKELDLLKNKKSTNLKVG